METLVVGLIIAGAVGFLAYRSWGVFSGQKSGCGTCGQQSQCQKPEKGSICDEFEV